MSGKILKSHLPVSEAEDTAAILCVEPLASSSSAPLLRLRLTSTVPSFFVPLQKATNAELKCFPALAFTLTLILLQCSHSIFSFLPLPLFISSYLNLSFPSFFVICFLSHPLHLTVALPSLFLYGYIHIYPLRSQSSSPSSTPFFCLLYLSELREKIVQCRRLEAKSTPSAAAPIRCLFIFLRENRGSCASHSLVSDDSSSSSSSVALYADCSQVDRRKDG